MVENNMGVVLFDQKLYSPRLALLGGHAQFVLQKRVKTKW